MRRAKKEADWRWGEKLVEDFTTNKRMFWRKVKRTRNGVEVREECVKDGNGRVLSEEGALILEHLRLELPPEHSLVCREVLYQLLSPPPISLIH